MQCPQAKGHKLFVLIKIHAFKQTIFPFALFACFIEHALLLYYIKSILCDPRFFIFATKILKVDNLVHLKQTGVS